jgi:hypothetical protein
MELAERSAPGATRLAGGRTPGTGLTWDRRQAARADLNRMPMTVRTAGARDDEIDRSRNTRVLPHRWLHPHDGGLPTGTAMSSTNNS